MASSTPSKWTTAADPTTGRMYYYHVETRQTCWTRPPDVPPARPAPSNKHVNNDGPRSSSIISARTKGAANETTMSNMKDSDSKTAALPPTSKHANNGPRSSSSSARTNATHPVAAEPTEPARTNSCIDRNKKTPPVKGGAGQRQPSGRPVNYSKKVKDDKAKRIVKGNAEHDVERGNVGTEETPQEDVMENFERNVDQQAQGNPQEDKQVSVPGAFHIRGINRHSSRWSSATSVLDQNDSEIGTTGNDSNVSGVVYQNASGGDTILVAHLVQEEEEEDNNIVVAVEADADESKRKRRRPLVVTGLLVTVFLLAGIVLTVALIRKPWYQEPAASTTNEDEDLTYRVLDTIDGEDESEFGTSVSMCSDGSRVAIGAQGSDEEKIVTKIPTVRVYQVDGIDNKDGSRSQVQIGQNLSCFFPDKLDSNNSASIIRSRVVVELSSNCQVLAIGCPFTTINNKTSVGIVKLYKYNSASNSWESEGNPNIITGLDENDLAGASLSLSQHGDRIAIGSPGHDWGETDAGQVRVFRINNGGWEIVGKPLNGTFPGEEFGGSISLAANDQSDTDMMAVGSSSRRSILDTCGLETAVAFRNYEYVGGDWQQRGHGIVPQGFDIDTAWFVKLSSNGKRLVVSNLYLDKDGIGINENDGIYAAAFELDSQGKKWEPRGGNIHRSVNGIKSGYMISLSDDGQRIAMGDPGKRGDDGAFSGHAHFYEFIGDRDTDGKWCQLGSKILGAAPGDMMGYSVSLSGNGTRMAIASPKSRALGNEHGRVIVVELLEEGSIETTCDVETPPSSSSLIALEGASPSLCTRSSR